jgi:hypothetical protein
MVILFVLRMYAIVNEVKRLSQQSNEQWIEWQHNIKDIAEFNSKLFYKRKDYEYAFERYKYNE